MQLFKYKLPIATFLKAIATADHSNMTLAELREEENLLLKERRELKMEVAALRVNLEKQRATSESLKRMKFHYGVFFAYMRLREQEIRNLMWISECVAQNQKSRVHDSVVFIF
ncbi:V-type proton ATPase subunit [Abeliophyllum distichum]|uniref:V-type proton ATPase subunit n=1 Tax=Abeliophyllum distichum TaxID=126358 RepID=A0ABD1V4V3_9LAMI